MNRKERGVSMMWTGTFKILANTCFVPSARRLQGRLQTTGASKGNKADGDSNKKRGNKSGRRRGTKGRCRRSLRPSTKLGKKKRESSTKNMLAKVREWDEPSHLSRRVKTVSVCEDEAGNSKARGRSMEATNSQTENLGVEYTGKALTFP